MMNKRKSLKKKLSNERVIAARARLYPAPPNPYRYRRAGKLPSDPNDLDWRDPSDFFRTRLHKAVEASNISMVKQLLAEGASPFISDSDRKTPLGVALNNGSLDIAKIIGFEMNKQHRDWNAYKIRNDRRYRYKLRHKALRSPKNVSP